jgi:hypothetical protein
MNDLKNLINWVSGLGLFQNNGYEWQSWRIPGVLMRFAVAYLVVGLVVLYVPKFSWRWIYRIHRRLSSGHRHRYASTFFPNNFIYFI